MTKQIGRVALMGLVVVWADATNVASAGGKKDAQKIFEKMMGAIKTNDREAFVADTTDDVKKGTTQEIMDALAKHLGTRLKKGYVATYLCQLKQAEHQVHLWKLTFKDDGDDVVIRIGIKDGKVGGFF